MLGAGGAAGVTERKRGEGTMANKERAVFVCKDEGDGFEKKKKYNNDARRQKRRRGF